MGEIYGKKGGEGKWITIGISLRHGVSLLPLKNHSKIYAGKGEKFAFGIQTSANVNTNPRTENGNIIITDEIYRFYKDYFDGIKSFE